MNKLMRRPSPDFTTAFATRKATVTNSTLELANPPNAFAGETVPVRTTAPTASIVEVSRGNAPTSTDAIAETNTANKCHARAVNPDGTGTNQTPIASTKGHASFSLTSGWLASRITSELAVTVTLPWREPPAAGPRALDPSVPWIGLAPCRPRLR